MKPNLLFTLIVLFLAVVACQRQNEPSKPAVAEGDAAVDDEEEELLSKIKFGGKITQKKQPLRTKIMEERKKKVILSNEKTSPASLLILENGTITVDVCRPGYDRRRRVDAESIHATLWIGKESHQFDLPVYESTKDRTGKGFRFQATRKQILCGEEMMLVVDLPNEAGDALERATFVIPAGFEPY